MQKYLTSHDWPKSIVQSPTMLLHLNCFPKIFNTNIYLYSIKKTFEKYCEINCPEHYLICSEPEGVYSVLIIWLKTLLAQNRRYIFLQNTWKMDTKSIQLTTSKVSTCTLFIAYTVCRYACTYCIVEDWKTAWQVQSYTMLLSIFLWYLPFASNST